ncbi:hypothetical protein [Roseibium polysiphoniae]|uniref:FkbM family methyltransferase n=1 Tax=Roseibium polysiphoniae TaxID=2571221 RepID=A0ABR9CDN9_9HYPH|nr:hypothetical protein [Roseibium polysiphoniae]MBD8877995.1 hypothetical protein [Roseibium polysiphoniae]
MGLFRSAANALLKPLGYTVIKTSNSTKTNRSIVYKHVSAINAALLQKLGHDALKGPFKGARIIEPGSTQVGADYVSRVLGEYELEIQAAIMNGLDGSPDAVINVGTSDGYYLSCIQHLHPKLPLIGYEINADAKAACKQLLGVASNIIMKGAVDCNGLLEDLTAYPSSLIIMDIEGHETILKELDPSTFAKATLIIELHEPLAPGITDQLATHFASTHAIEVLEQAGRNPFKHKELSEFDSSEKFLVLCEFRGAHQSWMVATPNHSPK